ncbi:universal stress protein [Mycobacterium sp.]|uniref:universal stress protein n=1 Tax=Mycobacterium sp. TaxID=1785 RepID=UPI0012254342|nr:universal stress protein [Mycobacterium sp.]TAM69015.1 MAG: universal stress protein [Mycobacterium sp.]
MSKVYSVPAIVVGIDGSRAAIHAAVWAIDEAVSRDIPLRLVYVIDPRDTSGVRAGDTLLAVAHAALVDAHRAVDAAGEPVKVETEILWGKTVLKLVEESRSAVMICVGQIGLKHACHGGPSVASSLVRLALCPVAIIQQSARPRVSSVVVEVDNGTVLRHAFEEARLRRATLRAVRISKNTRDGTFGNPTAHAQLDRRLTRWTRLYPDVHAEQAVAGGSVDRYLRAHPEAGRLLVTDSYRAEHLCDAGHSVLAIRCGNL